MPGHKFAKKIPSYLKRNLLAFDTTELSYSDNLYNSKGVLKELKEECAKTYKANDCMVLVNGSTQGILASFCSVFEPGDKVLVARDMHKSVINAIKLSGVLPIYVSYRVSVENSVIEPPDYEDFVCKYNSEKDIKGIFFTYPNYYGICCSAKRIIEFAKENNLISIIDQAHGSHFIYNERLPLSATEIRADITIMSFHKTLPTPNQTGAIFVNNKKYVEKVKKQVSVFGTSSPSYIFLLMIEYCLKYMKKSGKIELDRVIDYCNDIKDFNKLKRLENNDNTRIVLNVYETGYTGFEIAKILERGYNIFVEMADLFNIVLIATTNNTKKDFKKLKKALNKIDKLNIDKRFSKEIIFGSVCSDIKTNHEGNIEKNLMLYPPGVPVVLKGEVVSREKEEYIKMLVKCGGEVIQC